MSKATALTFPDDSPKKHRSTLDEPTRRAIVARIAQGESITNTAKHFGIHMNTASRIWNSVKRVNNAGLESLEQWRLKLDQGSFKAIESSVTDTQDVHKAASTGLSWLKGVGVLAGDQGTQVNVFMGSIANMPADLAGDYFEVEATPTGSGSAINNDAIDDTSR